MTGQRGSRVPGSKIEAKTSIDKEAKKENEEQDEAEPEYLGPEEARKFRALTARLNYISSDRPDLGYATKECARHGMSQVGSWCLLKQIARYLLVRPRLVSRYRFQDPPAYRSVYTDSDLGGMHTIKTQYVRWVYNDGSPVGKILV